MTGVQPCALPILGAGGLLIANFAEVEAWVGAIDKLDDRAYRDDVVSAGDRHVQEFSLFEQTEHFLDILRRILR